MDAHIALVIVLEEKALKLSRVFVLSLKHPTRPVESAVMLYEGSVTPALASVYTAMAFEAPHCCVGSAVQLVAEQVAVVVSVAGGVLPHLHWLPL